MKKFKQGMLLSFCLATNNLLYSINILGSICIFLTIYFYWKWGTGFICDDPNLYLLWINQRRVCLKFSRVSVKVELLLLRSSICHDFTVNHSNQAFLNFQWLPIRSLGTGKVLVLRLAAHARTWGLIYFCFNIEKLEVQKWLQLLPQQLLVQFHIKSDTHTKTPPQCIK